MAEPGSHLVSRSSNEQIVEVQKILNHRESERQIDAAGQPEWERYRFMGSTWSRRLSFAGFAVFVQAAGKAGSVVPDPSEDPCTGMHRLPDGIETPGGDGTRSPGPALVRPTNDLAGYTGRRGCLLRGSPSFAHQVDHGSGITGGQEIFRVQRWWQMVERIR